MPFRQFVVLVGLLVVVPIFCRAQINDDFSDGDFTNNPAWTGDVLEHTINGSNQLNSAGPSQSDTSYLSTATGNLDFSQTITWEFYVDLAFDPSNSNNARIYLVSDNPDLKGPLNGYFLRIGENGSADPLNFYIQTGLSSTSIFTGITNTYATSPTVRVRVTRSPSGVWSFEADPTGGTSFVSEGSVTDLTYTSTSYFGFFSKYSSLNGLNFVYDDIIVSGNVVVDSMPPTVSTVNATSPNTLSILFDEAVDPITAETTLNYSVNNTINNPSNATVNGSNPAQVDLTFTNSFVNLTNYTLTTQNVEDQASNIMVTSNDDFLYFVPDSAVAGDVIINEIFADPSPQIGLPAAEYIEIHNRSSGVFELSNWVISDASSNATLPTHTLLPGEVVAIADDDFTVDFSIFPNVVFVTSLPSLNNGSDELTLKDPNSNIIDQVTYSDAWYQSAAKDDGGYSLELINPNFPCSGPSNWIASNDPNGGTPGTQNSVYSITPDLTAPSIISNNVVNSISIEVCFDESLDSSMLNVGMFSLTGGSTVAFYSLSDDLSCVTLTVTPALDTGTVYAFTIDGPGDCSGNSMSSTEVSVVLPSLPSNGDIIINEVLFNPYTGGSDFVELYNNSDKYIDLQGMFLANLDDGIVDNYKPITPRFLMNPGEFVVITKDTANIKQNYLGAVPGRFIELSSLPTYSNDEGTVYLLLPDSTHSDVFSYEDDMQFALLKEENGVSLERIDYNRPTQEEDNWHSCAENAGWATPGKENSQYYPGQISEEMISTAPEIFSPDNDGFEDVLTINYTLDQPGYVGNITIYDREGRITRHLVESELLSTEGTFTWDGINNKREKARIGVYIIYFEVFDLSGNVSGVKKTCVLGGQL